MLDRIWVRHSGLWAACFGAIGALIYVLMITVTLAHLEAVSGEVPFDMRPLGYGLQEAATLLERLGDAGRSYYLSHQIALDTAYPALLMLTLLSLMRWFGQDIQGSRLVRIGMILSVAAALFDYIENLGIVVMILNWPNLSPLVVTASSIATIAKSATTTAAVVSVLLIAVVWAGQVKKPS